MRRQKRKKITSLYDDWLQLTGQSPTVGHRLSDFSPPWTEASDHLCFETKIREGVNQEKLVHCFILCATVNRTRPTKIIFSILN